METEGETFVSSFYSIIYEFDLCANDYVVQNLEKLRQHISRYMEELYFSSIDQKEQFLCRKIRNENKLKIKKKGNYLLLLYNFLVIKVKSNCLIS